jgi:hypothetical protein
MIAVLAGVEPWNLWTAGRIFWLARCRPSCLVLSNVVRKIRLTQEILYNAGSQLNEKNYLAMIFLMCTNPARPQAWKSVISY